MVTGDEIAAVAIFAGLGQAERERLSRAAADIALAPGEYAAHEGSERALFAVLEGRIEPVKLVDGVERVVGERGPGDIFGEVPIVLGTVFPVGFRAAEQSRDAARGARLPRGRRGRAGRREAGRRARGPPHGRMARAAGHGRRATPAARGRVVGHRWDASCAGLRHFLDRNQITFTG
jgi:thioredoxin reductase (NADPH)